VALAGKTPSSPRHNVSSNELHSDRGYSQSGGESEVGSDTAKCLLTALASLLPGRDTRSEWAGTISPAALNLARATKTDGLLYSLRALKADPAIEAEADALLKTNLRQIAWTIRIDRVLREAGISGIAFKGCLRSHEVYGSWGARRSSDIDFLVRMVDYERACRALAGAGYRPLVSAQSRWWHRHLGESPFVREDGSGVVVDLHNSVQQPGGPYPLDLEQFFTSRRPRSFGRDELDTLAPEHALLICAISYGKAIRASEPWLSKGHELATCLAAMDASEQNEMRRYAAQQGLARIYNEAADNSQRLFEVFDQDRRTPNALPDLVRSALADTHHTRFLRTREMWRWCDGNGARRVRNFCVAVARVIRRDTSQLREDFDGRRKLRWQT
jgi:hypothetical protein